MVGIPPGTNRTDTLFPYPTLFRARVGELAWSARLGVDEHRSLGLVGADLGAGRLLVEHPAEPAGDHLVHGGDVVLAVDGLDHEAAVFALAGQPVLEHDHAGHDLGALPV